MTRKQGDIKVLQKFLEYLHYDVMRNFPIKEFSNFATIAILYVIEVYENTSVEERKALVKKFVELRLKAEQMGFLQNSSEIKTEAVENA